MCCAVAVSNPNRMCVATSRARERLIIVGDEVTLRYLALIQNHGLQQTANWFYSAFRKPVSVRCPTAAPACQGESLEVSEPHPQKLDTMCSHRSIADRHILASLLSSCRVRSSNLWKNLLAAAHSDTVQGTLATIEAQATALGM